MGKNGGLHEVAQRVADRARRLARAVDVQHGVPVAEGAVEREPEDVVEVQMGEERRRSDRWATGRMVR